MRLAIITHNVFRGDGQSRVNYELARHALLAGHDVTLVAARIDPALLAEGARWARVRPGIERPHLAKVVAFVRGADAALARGSFDAVIASGVTLSRPHALNAVHFVHSTWLRSPVAAAEFGRGLYGRYQQTYTAANAWMERRVFGRAQQIVAVSETVRTQLAAAGVAPDRVAVIPNGVDPAAARPAGDAAALRRAMHVPAGAPLALFAGDIRTRRKNLDTLLAALAEVPELHLAVAGAAAGSPFPALAERLGVAGRVRFLGFRDDVPALLAAADFFVMPSRVDSFSLVLLEAMAAGRPVVTAATVGAAALVPPAAGIVIPDPEDRAALAEALARLAGDATRRAAMGAAARAIAAEYSWERTAAAYLQLLAELPPAGARA
jgi:glycosyltransferase involved in cell wall biosynthesis